MTPLYLEFRPNALLGALGHAASQGQRLMAALAAIAALLLGTWVGWRHLELREREQAQRQRLLAVAPRAPSSARPPTPVRPQAQLQAFGRMVERLDTPWPAILDALEQHATPEVALLSIEPDAIRARVRLEFEAKQLPPLLDFVRQLEGAGPFSRVDLAKHELVEREPGSPYRMVLEASLAQRRVQGTPGVKR